MRHAITKPGIIAGLVGSMFLSAAGSSLAKPRTIITSGNTPYNYTCEPSWFSPGYYCYQPAPYYVYNAYPGYYAHGSYNSCTEAVWNGWQWVSKQVC
jgi:hypothetical protein